jgi:hypothetical protein
MLLPARNALDPEGIEAGEYLRNWVLNLFLLGTYFEYLPIYIREIESFRMQGDPWPPKKKEGPEEEEEGEEVDDKEDFTKLD